jgi:hypothetical protein
MKSAIPSDLLKLNKTLRGLAKNSGQTIKNSGSPSESRSGFA